MRQFGRNFASEAEITFPSVIFASNNLLVETFEVSCSQNFALCLRTDNVFQEGVHVGEFIGKLVDEKFREQSVKTRQQLALRGTRALLKMIFVDNFVHGDLHPGNILIRAAPDHRQDEVCRNKHKRRQGILDRLVQYSNV